MQNANAYALFWTLFFIGSVIVAARLVIRLRYGLRKWFMEDILIILAWFSYLGLVIDLSAGVSDGLAASTRGDLSQEMSVAVLKIFFFHGYFLYITLWLVKTSIIAFYARLCWNTSRTYRIITYITYLALGISFIVVLFYKSFFCFPMRRVWNPHDQCTGGSTSQYTRTAYLITISVMDICTDLLCLVLPFCILKNLRIDAQKKIALGLLFALAMLSLICACIRLSYGVSQATKFIVAVWGVIEATTALCVASAPALRPLIFRTSYFSRSTSNRLGGSAASRPITRGQMVGMTGTASTRPLRDRDGMRRSAPQGKIEEEISAIDADEETNQSSADSFLDENMLSEAIEREKVPDVMGFSLNLIRERGMENTLYENV